MLYDLLKDPIPASRIDYHDEQAYPHWPYWLGCYRLSDNAFERHSEVKIEFHWYHLVEANIMCRNIKTLHNFKPPATEEEIRASSLQFVRKLSGFTKPSKTNEQAFNRAIDQVAQAAHELLQSLVTNAPARDREVEAAKARARTANRFHSSEVTPA